MAEPVETLKLDDADALRQALGAIAGNDDPQALIEIVVKLLVQLSGENKRLQLRLAKALNSLYGRKSEKINPDQLALFRELLEQSEKDEPGNAKPDDAKPDGEAPKPDDKKDKDKAKGSKNTHGRGKLPAHLPRVDNIIPVPDADRICSVCGATKQCIGHAQSERLDYVPATLRVIVDRREKVACRPCQGEVSIAPTAPKVVDGGMAAAGLVAHVLVSKYIDGLTLTRLARIYARSGVRIPESTLGDIVRDGAHQLLGVAKHIEQQALASYVINQDDTGLRVLDREHPNGIKRGHIWTFCGDAKWVAYRYCPDWRGEHPCAFLETYRGVVQGDGYSGINSLFGATLTDQGPTRAGCMMHARRYFFKANKAGDPRGGIALAFFHDLYEIEREAKERKLSAPQRLELRQQRSLPIVERLKNWMDKVAVGTLPKSDLGKAITYARNQWASLMVPLHDGRLEIDNGEAERRLKVFATGRKNWLFAGSDKGAERAATILTVLGTAVVQGVDPLAYLTHIFDRIATGISGSRLAELMPIPWAKQQGQQAGAEQAPIPRLVV